MLSPVALEEFELVTLKSGIVSLREIGNGETFHPVTGPRLEAKILHVDQQRLLERSAHQSPFVIWDVGFGAAANALTAIESIRCSSGQIELHSFDRTTGPIEFALKNAQELNYLVGHEAQLLELISLREVSLSPTLRWKLHLGDFRDQLSREDLPSPHAIFYDPYSPSMNIDMWTLDHFRRLRARLDAKVPCLLTNYTCSTAVRTTLLLAGFYVGTGCGVGEKAETTLFSNDMSLLEKPLDRSWLKRVRVSHSAAPLITQWATKFISDSDFELLQALPQFN